MPPNSSSVERDSLKKSSKMNNNEETKDITYYQKENERLQEGLKNGHSTPVY